MKASSTVTFPIVAIVVVASLVGCSRSGPSAPAEGTRPQGPGARIGDRVVVENAVATFVEGVVVSVSRDKARLLTTAGAELSEVAFADLYVPSASDAPPTGPATAEPASSDAHATESAPLRTGSFAVCRTPSSGWRGCRIESTGPLVRVVDDEANAAELPWHDVLAPTSMTELNVRQRFDRNARRRAFRDEARAAGRPRVPTNWRPGMNERVIVERDGAWVGAQAKGLNRGFVRVKWDTDQRLSDAMTADVAPEPPFEFAPTVGVYVLARPAMSGRVWPVMRVESTGLASLQLSDEYGDRHQAALRDVVPLERTR